MQKQEQQKKRRVKSKYEELRWLLIRELGENYYESWKKRIGIKHLNELKDPEFAYWTDKFTTMIYFSGVPQIGSNIYHNQSSNEN